MTFVLGHWLACASPPEINVEINRIFVNDFIFIPPSVTGGAYPPFRICRFSACHPDWRQTARNIPLVDCLQAVCHRAHLRRRQITRTLSRVARCVPLLTDEDVMSKLADPDIRVWKKETDLYSPNEAQRNPGEPDTTLPALRPCGPASGLRGWCTGAGYAPPLEGGCNICR